MIEKRQTRQKTELFELFKKTPIVQIACEKVGVGRATYYRWRKDDKEFANAADEALVQGAHLINDMAESQLISAIREKNMTAIIYWLKHRHPAYATRVELSVNKPQSEELTPEQEQLVREALQRAGLLTAPSSESHNSDESSPPVS